MEMKGTANINIITLAAIGVLFCGLAATASSAGKHHFIASYYKQPYVPSACFGNEPLDTNLFLISLGDKLWDNGRACGSFYDVTCLPELGNQCIEHEGGSFTATAKVVDRCRDCGDADMLLSLEAYTSIADVDGNGRIKVSYKKTIAS